MVHIKAGQTQIMFDVDHVVPKRWAGIDHPRNYVVMHQSMNRSFGDEKPELWRAEPVRASQGCRIHSASVW